MKMEGVGRRFPACIDRECETTENNQTNEQIRSFRFVSLFSFSSHSLSSDLRFNSSSLSFKSLIVLAVDKR